MSIVEEGFLAGIVVAIFSIVFAALYSYFALVVINLIVNKKLKFKFND